MKDKALVIIVGGSLIRAGIVSVDGHQSDLKYCWEGPSQRSYDGIIADVCKAFAELGGDTFGSVVLGLPGRVQKDSGSVLLPPAFGCTEAMPISSDVGKALQIPVLVENDVNLMALGEFVSIGVQRSSLTLIVVGTGVGAANIVDSRIIRGETGLAGEVGYLRTFYQGRMVSIRELCAGGSLDKERERLNKTDEPYPDADIVERVGTGVMQLIISSILIIDPGIIVLSGGVINSYGKEVVSFCRSELANYRGQLLAESLSRIRIELSSLGHSAALIGGLELLRAENAVI